ncbi:hypothetical protein SAMN06297387_102156 [Streptomyces zhaozhouensis]|uniref:Uncharacterized protein n=1 Tax=Streptomyces zhaozhouensis TaxID=1300267 RepID=A0A286DPQ3_9ACTN|nr:hypothetical protein SAMN06297387_102156 [Streptomyces zhaozhouensis]
MALSRAGEGGSGRTVEGRGWCGTLPAASGECFPRSEDGTFVAAALRAPQRADAQRFGRAPRPAERCAGGGGGPGRSFRQVKGRPGDHETVVVRGGRSVRRDRFGASWAPRRGSASTRPSVALAISFPASSPPNIETRRARASARAVWCDTRVTRWARAPVNSTVRSRRCSGRASGVLMTRPPRSRRPRCFRQRRPARRPRAGATGGDGPGAWSPRQCAAGVSRRVRISNGRRRSRSRSGGVGWSASGRSSRSVTAAPASGRSQSSRAVARPPSDS